MFIFIISSLLSQDKEFDKQRYILGEKTFEDHCSACHLKSIYIQEPLDDFLANGNKTLKLLAPTGNQILNRIKSQVDDEEDINYNLQKTSDLLIDYTFNPDIMPKLEGSITEEQLEDINYFLYFLDESNGINNY